jgi:serine/threonine protein kinase
VLTGSKPMLSSQSTQIMGYTLGETIGRGSTGVVKLGIDKTQRLVAIKIVSKSSPPGSCERFKKEILIQYSCKHDNIIRAFGALEGIRSLTFDSKTFL